MLFSKRPLGLKTHALIVSLSMTSLIAILGVRAYSVAQSHVAETQTLVEYDLNAQGLLVRLESILAMRDQADRKHRVSGDRRYLELVTRYESTLGVAREELRAKLEPIYPQVAETAIRIVTMRDVQDLKTAIQAQRDGKLRHTQSEALGLLELIGIALLVCVGVTAWLIYLFYRGLIDPLSELRHATSQISEGELSHRLLATHGVAELQELSLAFNSMAQRLESLEDAKSEFLATVSHEIKNPLAALKEGLSFLAEKDPTLSPQSRAKGFGACLIASKRLEVMINNLLKLSRGESGLYEFDLDRKNLSEAIQCAADEVRPLAEKRGMNIQLRMPEALQASFNWDGIVQVFENLFVNAIKYGDEKSPIEVHVVSVIRPLRQTSGPDVPHVEVSVINSGGSIGTSESARLFDRFYRGSNVGSKQGLGIGLHVVKRIIEAHHGSVAAKSEGERTYFQIWIPGVFV